MSPYHQLVTLPRICHFDKYYCIYSKYYLIQKDHGNVPALQFETKPGLNNNGCLVAQGNQILYFGNQHPICGCPTGQPTHSFKDCRTECTYVAHDLQETKTRE